MPRRAGLRMTSRIVPVCVYQACLCHRLQLVANRGRLSRPIFSWGLQIGAGTKARELLKRGRRKAERGRELLPEKRGAQ